MLRVRPERPVDRGADGRAGGSQRQVRRPVSAKREVRAAPRSGVRAAQPNGARSGPSVLRPSAEAHRRPRAAAASRPRRRARRSAAASSGSIDVGVLDAVARRLLPPPLACRRGHKASSARRTARSPAASIATCQPRASSASTSATAGLASAGQARCPVVAAVPVSRARASRRSALRRRRRARCAREAGLQQRIIGIALGDRIEIVGAVRGRRSPRRRPAAASAPASPRRVVEIEVAGRRADVLDAGDAALLRLANGYAAARRRGLRAPAWAWRAWPAPSRRPSAGRSPARGDRGRSTPCGGFGGAAGDARGLERAGCSPTARGRPATAARPGGSSTAASSSARVGRSANVS